MLEYLKYLLEKILVFFGKNQEDYSKLKQIIIENKKFLSTIINIQDNYTKNQLTEIINHEIKQLNMYMNKSSEIEELRFEDIEKHTFLNDILEKLNTLDE